MLATKLNERRLFLSNKKNMEPDYIIIVYYYFQMIILNTPFKLKKKYKFILNCKTVGCNQNTLSIKYGKTKI